ncbi:MAG: GNAT family N-acetyltransferase [Pyrinomonadaceae bacterium]|nr:GNAT family N-acetyltransferase [Pyrinomonadaceae bacterium]
MDLQYEEIFSGYSASLRNHVRKARRLGVTVRGTDSLEDFEAYYKVHLQRVEQKGGYSFVFPLEFLSELIKIHRTARFLVAESEGRIVAGGLFLRDGCSVFYLHGALDEQFSHLYPSCAIFDDAIRWASEKGAAFFNFGGSGTITSLEKFKSSWGARPELNWRFEWKNPLWTHLSRLKGALLRGKHQKVRS